MALLIIIAIGIGLFLALFYRVESYKFVKDATYIISEIKSVLEPAHTVNKILNFISKN